MNNEKAVFCFGELLLRLSPLPNGQWIEQAAMPVYVGGAELNVAQALASWQVPVKYGTALPDNALSRDICSAMAAKNIDVSGIHFSGNRIGLYYLTQGIDLKGGSVIYDRAHTAFSTLQPGAIPWDEVLKNVGWLHFSAISPALSENVVAVCHEALEAAAAKGITISIDLNYRAKLWQWGKPPIAVMPGLVEYCDVIMGNIWSANALLGVPVDADIHAKKSKAAYLQHAKATAHALLQQYPKCKWVAQTFRFDYGEQGIQYYAVLDDAQQQYVSKEYFVNNIQDKVGSGDCLMAGLIYGFARQHQPQQVINFAAAAAVGKMNEIGDATRQTVADVTTIMNS